MGADQSLEEKKNRSSEDRSLEDVWAFCSTKNQICATNKSEGLVFRDKVGKTIDRRAKIIYSDPKYNFSSYRALCQLTVKLPSGKKAVGSCKGIKLRNERYILTCAHNVVGWSSLKNRWVNYESMFMYRARQGEKSWRICRSISQKHVHVHPKHNGHCDSGFDIAICKQMELDSKNRKTESFCSSDSIINDSSWNSVNPKLLKKGMSIEVAGYPGEKKGHPHTHAGVIAHVTETPLGGHLIWYNVDCTPGNSGSSIMITDESFLKAHKDFSRWKKVTIGVHTGFDHNEGLNFGTLITPSICDWIQNF